MKTPLSILKSIFICALIFVSFSHCSKEKCDYDECGTKAPDSEIQTLENYLQSNNISATRHCTGIFYKVSEQGSGAKPTGCGAVSVYYKGKLTDGTTFDETRPNSPAVFNLGGLIPGFRNGMLQIKSGGKVTIYIPPSLGYGSNANGPIPANSILIFEVELLDAN